jgi:energy-coupling factor transporter ATPase
MRDAFFRLRGVRFTYPPSRGADPAGGDGSAAGDGVPAIDGVDWDVPEGAFVAVLGGNGSGKSTLARLLNGLLVPTEGTVSVAGLDTARPEHRWEVRRLVGLVFQNPENQIVATTVEDDAAFGPENLGLPPEEIRRRVAEALAAVGLAEHADREVHRLSGGQKQRLAIAGVLAMRPRCLVLDEPTSLLDPVGRAEVLEVVRDLHARGTTVVLVTHRLEEAALADRVVVLDRGRIALQGGPREVLTCEAELAALGLDAPEAVRATRLLRAVGIRVPGVPVTVEELASALLGLASRRNRLAAPSPAPDPAAGP